MNAATPLLLAPGHAVARAAVPTLPVADFRQTLHHLAHAGDRLVAFFGAPVAADARAVRIYAIVAHPHRSTLAVLACDVVERYAALTPDWLQAHWFERELAEQWGVHPEGHPWLKPIRFHRSYRNGHDAWGRAPDAALAPSVTDFFQLTGEEVHEVAVGPVHAGIIEPGHFRFQCHGEDVFHLEISLGYQHRGVERALVGGPSPRTVPYMETLAGDTSVGHLTAHCQAVEALAGVACPPRAMALRAIALELERLANHTGDLGALSNDVAYLPTASFCGRLRGDFLNLTAFVCGNRFGRGWLRPGGVAYDLPAARVDAARQRLDAALRDTAGAVRLLWETPSVMARFEETGVVDKETALSLGLVGVAARASGLPRDVRAEFPAGAYRDAKLPLAQGVAGDVYARAWVRAQEIEAAGAFIRAQLATLPDSPTRVPVGPLQPDALAVGLSEGWRGEIVHVALTDAQGRFARYKVVDPSFHNWMGLALALRGQQISDFPLCNKSFNLSYCGHDL